MSVKVQIHYQARLGLIEIREIRFTTDLIGLPFFASSSYVYILFNEIEYVRRGDHFHFAFVVVNCRAYERLMRRLKWTSDVVIVECYLCESRS